MTYLIDVARRPLVSSGNSGSPASPEPGSDLYYSCYLYNRHTNPDERISIFGRLPEDFAFNLQSQWEAPFDSVFGDIAGGLGAGIGALTGAGSGAGRSAGNLFGKATGLTRAVVGSAKTWSGNTEIQIDLPIKIQAYDNTRKEIMEPMKKILKAVTPHLNVSGILIPPGPSPINFDLSTFGAGNSKEWASAMLKSFGEKAFYVQVGTWFKMFPAILEGVTINFDGLVEHGTGHPLFMDITFQIKSYLTPTKYDIDNWIKIR
jgi:hypothetical protein